MTEYGYGSSKNKKDATRREGGKEGGREGGAASANLDVALFGVEHQSLQPPVFLRLLLLPLFPRLSISRPLPGGRGGGGGGRSRRRRVMTTEGLWVDRTVE